MLVASIALIVSMASAIDSSVVKQAAQDFGVSKLVESMATGLFLIAFGFGALFAGPVSETLGRNPVYVGTLAMYMIFIMASALAPNIGAQLVFRFVAGFFGSTPLTCAGGTLSDLWDPVQRIWAFPIFASSAFVGKRSPSPLITSRKRMLTQNDQVHWLAQLWLGGSDKAHTCPGDGLNG
jgi:MFS family permease